MKKYNLTPRQLQALEKLAAAFEELSEVWDSTDGPDSWEGPSNFGGELWDRRLLPESSLGEAGAELRHMVFELTDCDTCHGAREIKLWPYAQIDFENPQKPILVPCPKCRWEGYNA